MNHITEHADLRAGFLSREIFILTRSSQSLSLESVFYEIFQFKSAFQTLFEIHKILLECNSPCTLTVTAYNFFVIAVKRLPQYMADHTERINLILQNPAASPNARKINLHCDDLSISWTTK